MTGLALAPVDAKIVLEIAEFARRLCIIAQGRAARGNGAVENGRNHLGKACKFAVRDAAARTRRADARFEQRLADVDVAEARNAAAIEKQRLYGRQAALHRIGKRRPREVATERLRSASGNERVRAEAVGGRYVERSEASRIVQGDAALGGFEQHMVVRRVLRRVEAQAAGHAEVEDDAVAAVGVDQPIFGAATDRCDARALQTLAEIGRDRPAQIGAAHLHAGQPFALYERRDAAHRGFDLGKFGHVSDIVAFAPLPSCGYAAAMQDETVSYGFQDVSPEEKTRRVGSVFERVARRYDLMNDLMSGGMHRLWKDRFVRQVRPRAGERILDMAGGTGDIAFRLARAGANVMVSDINPHMLAEGEKRAPATLADRLQWQVENAETLSFGDAAFDGYTIAFGIRNVTDIPAALAEARRVLKYGGRFFCLEFSRMEWPVAAQVYDLYSLNLVPKIGKVVASDEEAYRYLVESIRRFPPMPEFARMIETAGFSRVGYTPILGGAVAIHHGWKL